MDQVARFRRDLEALTSEPPSCARMLGLAVSGGSDSMAMLVLAAAAYPGAVRAATVDHGLRPEAAAEAALVATACAARAVPHDALALPADHVFAGNLQEQARSGRYTTLHHWARDHAAIGWVAVAHQRDDVAEGLLMRARRGAGVGGLAEMPRRRAIDAPFATGKPLLRPMLEWSRAELRGLLEASGTLFVEDPSNHAARFDRARIRALLAASPELPASRLALAARNLRHAEDAIEWLVAREMPARLRVDGEYDVRLRVTDLPYELRRRFVRIAVEHVRFENGLYDGWRESKVDRLVATLDAGGIGTLAGVRARAGQGEWRFALAPPRRSL